MLIKRLGGALVVRAPAKVNLFLEIIAKRSDGYHEIATLMVAVNLRDTLSIKEAPPAETRLECDDPGLSTGPENLVNRAAELLRRRTGRRDGVRIRLRKRIPIAAGLGGGSSDAAATLRGLNELWELGLSKPELMTLGAELGSDVPFFLSGPVSWCTGRGEQVAPMPMPASFWVVLVCPTFGLSTAEVYSRATVPECPETGEEIRQALGEGRIEEVGERLHNRLQAIAEDMKPAVLDIRERLQRLNPAGQLVSGSGPSVFALCRNRREALRIARELRHGRREESSPRVFLVRSCSTS
jgi:4-diphosphocytidyl-2-C-methyl-D-erythritol kinase